MVVRNNDITGTIRANGQLYFVHPLSDGLHAIARMDESGFVDYDAGFSDVEDASADFDETHGVNSMLEASESSALGGNVIYLIVAYTPIAASEVGDIDALILLAVAETKMSYANSNIEPRVALTHKFALTQNESGSFSTDLNRLINTSDGWYDEIHSLRDAHGWDVGLIITRDYGGACGLASSILASDDTQAFAAASQSCATGIRLVMRLAISKGRGTILRPMGQLRLSRTDMANITRPEAGAQSCRTTALAGAPA